MKTIVYICAGVATLAIGIICVAWHFMTKEKNREKIKPAQDKRWVKDPVNNGQAVEEPIIQQQ